MGWTDTLLTGIKEIDDQHKVLFDVIARLEMAVSAEEKWSAVHYALVELSSYVTIHFAVEEALMRLHDYPQLDAHIASHRAFSAALADIKKHSIRQDVSEAMTTLVKTWLVQHIGKEDLAYVPHLRSSRLSGTAE